MKVKDKEIIKKFREKMAKASKVDLSDKDQYYDFCERLSKKTYPEMIAKDRLRATSMAKSFSKKFG